jgi:hypothetical protein
MSEAQILTLLATCLGLVGTVLNLAAFFREKDQGVRRAGVGLVFLLFLSVGLYLMPRYSPTSAARLLEAMPPALANRLRPWLATARPTDSSLPAAQPGPGLLGSFTIEIQRNLLGGIGALVSDFQFSNPSKQPVRVTAYRISFVAEADELAKSYQRVLPQPLLVEAHSNGHLQVELDAEIRDRWVARHRLEQAERGPIAISWQCQSADGKLFEISSSNG